MSNHLGSVISSLIAIITTAATSIETYLKSNSEHAYVPSLDNTEPHPLDDAIYPLDIKHAVQCLEGACLQLCATLLRPNNDSQVFQHPCMGIVLRAGVADIILDKPAGMPVSEISERCGVDPKKLGRVLRLLCSQHIFREVSPGIFANNWLSMQLLSANPMWSVGMHLSDEPINKAAAHLADTILDSEWGHANSPYKSAFNRSTGYPHALWTYFEGSLDTSYSMTDENAIRALVNESKAMSPASRQLIHEHVMQSTTGSEVGEGTGAQLVPAPLLPNYGAGRARLYCLDIAMMTLGNSAERTLDEFIKLGEAAGLRFVRLWNLAEMGVVEMALAKRE
ncbi:hypothetical protein AN958_01956 [Leucoagaricus sp. SymC.cos]|nr:hypothetical protein AN958_01956 [Leucoagaricus sp. SymC.cos]